MSKKDANGDYQIIYRAPETKDAQRSAAPRQAAGSGWDNEGLTGEQVREMQGYYGAEADGLWGPKSSAAAGGLGARDAWEKYSGRGEAASGTGAPAQSGFAYEKAPQYTELYRQQSEALARAVLEREPFRYDPESDPQYAAYRKQYAREGRRAAEDVLGRYAAMTGGMPSTAAVTAAQQAGDYYAAQAADKVPELYKLAYSMYADEDARARRDLDLLRDLEGDNYARFKGALAQYDADRAFAYGQYRDAVEDAAAAEKQRLEWAKLAKKK